MRKRRILMILLVIAALFTLSGCSIPTDDAGNFIRITTDTTFSQVMQDENWFTAIFVFPIAQVINFMVGSGLNVGIAITLVTVLVHAIILAATWKSNINQAKLQELQPELTKIQKKYEGKTDDQSRNRQAQEMQQLYKKNDVNPLGTMLSTFIQFPVIIAMYQAVQRAEVVATGSFMGLSLETAPWDGFQAGQYGYLVLFAIMIVAQFAGMRIPTWLTERRARREAEKRHKKYEKQTNSMQNSMYFMILFIAFLAASWPAAMSLYWIISSVVNVGKQVFLHKIMGRQAANK